MPQPTALDFVDCDRLVRNFVDLASVDGPSGRESGIGARVQAELESLGLTCEYDNAGELTHGDSGNLFGWMEGTRHDVEPIFLSCHLDTVLPTQDLVPVVGDGKIATDGCSILGADDRAALAAYIEAIRAIQQSGRQTCSIQLLLTVSEQPGLVGARALDFGKVRAQRGYVYDHYEDVSYLFTRGAYSDRLTFSFDAPGGHIAEVPDRRNVFAVVGQAMADMRLGQVNDQTVANLGRIGGGTMTSMIPHGLDLSGEVRSYSAELLEEQVAHMTETLTAQAERSGIGVRVVREKKYEGWSVPPESDHVGAAERATRRIGLSPVLSESLGGADTNIFNEKGLTCMTIGVGFKQIHSFSEYIATEDLVNLGRHVTALVEEVSGD